MSCLHLPGSVCKVAYILASNVSKRRAARPDRTATRLSPPDYRTENSQLARFLYGKRKMLLLGKWLPRCQVVVYLYAARKRRRDEPMQFKCSGNWQSSWRFVQMGPAPTKPALSLSCPSVLRKAIAVRCRSSFYFILSSLFLLLLQNYVRLCLSLSSS